MYCFHRIYDCRKNLKIILRLYLEFKLKRDERRNYLLEEIKQEIKHNKLISKKHKKICRAFNYVEHLLILVSTVTGRISISAFGLLAGIPTGNTNTSSAAELKMCAITAVIKKYKPIIKIKRKERLVRLAKKGNAIEVLIFKALIDSYISHEKFVSVC